MNETITPIIPDARAIAKHLFSSHDILLAGTAVIKSEHSAADLRAVDVGIIFLIMGKQRGMARVDSTCREGRNRSAVIPDCLNMLLRQQHR